MPDSESPKPPTLLELLSAPARREANPARPASVSQLPERPQTTPAAPEDQSARSKSGPEQLRSPVLSPEVDKIRRPIEKTPAELKQQSLLKHAAKAKPAVAKPAVRVDLPPLPQPRRKKSYASLISFILCVVLPAVAVTTYYLLIASPQYVSTFRFTVRDSRAAASAGASDGGIAAIGMSVGLSSSPNSLENFMAVDYLTSREAVDEIQSAIDIRKLYSRPEADWLVRFDDNLPAERLVAYWKRMVSATYDPITGLAQAEVHAFTPEDTYLIATTMVKMAEQLINNIAIRPQRDAMRFAEEELKRAEARLKITSAELTRFRAVEQVIDPQSNVVNSNLLLAQTLRANLAQLQTDLATLKKQNLGPGATMIVQLEMRIKSTREQLAAVEGEVGNSRDGANILSKVVGDYEQLTLERGFAMDQVKSAKATFEQARQSAMIQHMYVTPFVSPSLPQSSTYPKRYLSIIVATFGCFLFWLVGTLVIRSVREQLA